MSQLDAARQFWNRLTMQQRVVLGGVVGGALLLMVAMMLWTSRPDMTLLFGGLSPEDANTVVETLRDEGTKYDLKENGTAVYVARDKVYELRLRFAAQGLAGDGQVGYELFDGNMLGMTDFMQKLNLKRALEGELARTIAALGQVQMARVHLVIPERSAFAEEQDEPTASVVLQTGRGVSLNREEVAGIVSLVAGAVEGLSDDNVTVLDVRGNLLSSPDGRDADAILTSNQIRVQRATEEHLAKSGQTMLDQMLGPGNAIVRVAAELDFSRGVQERELIDPESATVVSEEKLDEQSPDAGAANSTVRNYELSRTRERTEKSTGEIKYLTVSVILNQKQVPVAIEGQEVEADEPVLEPQPYDPAEVEDITALVQNAVGFRPDRGDRFALHQTRFDTSVDDAAEREMQLIVQQQQNQVYIRYGLMALALLIVAWLLWSASRRITAPVKVEAEMTGSKKLSRASVSPDGKLVDDEAEEGLVLVDDMYTNKLSPEAKARLKAKHKMFEEIQQHAVDAPGEAADLIRSWLVEDVESGAVKLRVPAGGEPAVGAS
jgi:flagellar M-ring protein FliF